MRNYVNMPRKIQVGDYIYGHFISLDTGEESRVDFDFVLIDREKGITNSIRDSKPRKLADLLDDEPVVESPIVYTDSPLGKIMLGRFPETTFVLDNTTKFYVDGIMRYSEALQKQKHTK